MKSLALIVLSVLFCFAFLETLLFLTEEKEVVDTTIGAKWDKTGNSPLHVRSPNKDLVYELRPNANVYVKRFNRNIKTNPSGFRDRKFPPNKKNGTYRIVVVGDSVTFGWDQPMDKTYPKLVETVLSKRHPQKKIEVFNMGVGGYNSIQEVEVIKTKALQFDPDLIIVGYVHNDNEVGMDAGLWRYFSKSWSRSYDFLKTRWLRLKHKVGPSVSSTAFSELKRVATPKKIPVLIVIFPLLRLDENGNYPYIDLTEEVEMLSQKNNFMTLDLFPSFQKIGLEKLKLSENDLIHPNNAGHFVAAYAISEYLSGKMKPLQ